MKTLSLLALLAALIYFNHGSSKAAPKMADAVTQPASNQVASKIVIASASSYNDRWKTGPNACTGLKTGPNAQVTFEPFLPDSQANWNQNQPWGCTSISGVFFRR